MIDSTTAARVLNWKNQLSIQEAVTRTANWWESVLSQNVLAKEACTKEIGQILEMQFSEK